MKKKKPETVWFTNSEGLVVGFPATATIAELTAAGITVRLAGKETPPSKTCFVHDPKKKQP